MTFTLAAHQTILRLFNAQMPSIFLSKHRFLVVLMAVALMYTGLCATAKADRLTQAETLITSLLADIEAVKAQGSQLSHSERSQKLERLMDVYFDVEGITRFTAGRYWRAATADQRENYSRLFRGILLSEASNRFDQILNFSFMAAQAQARGDKLILVSGIAHDNTGQFPDTEIIWRVSAIEGQPMQIIDLEIENISMLKTQQDENTALVKRSGGDFTALIDAMRAKLDEIQNQKAN